MDRICFVAWTVQEPAGKVAVHEVQIPMDIHCTAEPILVATLRIYIY